MRVLIIGFDNVKELDNVMEELVQESQCYLFTIVCGNRNNIAYEYAEKRGVPVVFEQVDAPYKLVNKADFLVIRLLDGSPQWYKNLIMAFKNEGKHGKVIR